MMKKQIWCSAAILVLIGGWSSAWADDPWSQTPQWAPPDVEVVRSEMLAWIAEYEINGEDSIAEPLRESLTATWQAVPETASPDELLSQFADTARPLDPRAAALVDVTTHAAKVASLPDTSWLHDSMLPPAVVKNLQLLMGRWYAQEGYYDEAISILADVTPDHVIDPATLLFCQMVSHQQLVQVDPALQTAKQLLQREDEIPIRYQQLATLIAQDVAEVEEDSLDHIARRMGDIRRRLAKGRTDDKVIEVEDGVIESLDKLIDKMEQQRQQQQQQQQQAQQGGKTPTNPMQDSMLPRGMNAPGHVDRHNANNRGEWGGLDGKDREEALQDVGRDFPSHYRDVIEQYFKKIAAEGSDGSE